MLLSARLRSFAPQAVVFLGAAIAVAAYLQALYFNPVFDDIVHVGTNTKLLELRIADLWRLFAEPFNDFFEFLPLRDLSFWVDIKLFGLNPPAFRLHNIFLYLLSLPLMFGITANLWRYFRPTDAASAPWAAATVTALFALHPALVESVVLISGRKYVLPNLFALLALWFAFAARRERGLSAPHAVAALLAFVAMMLSKTSYFAVAPVIAMLWLLFWYDIPKPDRRRSMLLWPLVLLVLAGTLVLIFIFVATSQGGVPAYFGVETTTRSLALLGWLVRLAVSPEGRHYFYPVFEDPYLPAMVALGSVVLAVALGGAVMLLRKRSLTGFALVVFLLLSLPYLHLFPFMSPSLVQDRYLSLAAWPVILLAVAWAWRLRPLTRSGLLLVIALAWGFQTVQRVRDWRSVETILNVDIRAYPDYYMPTVYKILGIQLPQKLYRDALTAANGITVTEFRDVVSKWVEATYAVEVTAVSTGNPQSAMALLWQIGLDLKKPLPVQANWNSPVHLLWGKGRYVLKENWEYLAAQFPHNESVRYNAGLWLLGNGHLAEAIPHLRVATESQRLPPSVRGTAYKNLGLALLNSGQSTASEAPLRAALEQSPPDMRAYCLLEKMYALDDRSEAAAQAKAGCDRFAPTDTSP